MRELIRIDQGLALVADGQLEGIVRDAGGVGDIRLGRVVNVEHGVSAAFLDIGTGDNAFLHISDWPDAQRDDGIDDHLPLGTRAIVQLTRTAVGDKAAAISGNISLAGRFVVLLPRRAAGGISRRLDPSAREQQRALEQRAGCGVILRTAARDVSGEQLRAELDALVNEWADILKQAEQRPDPGLLRGEADAEERARRDFDLAADVPIRDGPPDADAARQLAEVGARKVALPAGGAVVFEQTEALLAIDVNSGRAREQGEFDATVRRTNLEAALTIARQLRLRDAGGVIVVDFIDMRDEASVSELDEAFRRALAFDRARVEIGGLGPFSLFTLTRRRRR